MASEPPRRSAGLTEMIGSHLRRLYDLCGLFFHSAVKKAISESQSQLANPSYDLPAVLSAFVASIEQDPKVFETVVLDFYLNLVRESPPLPRETVKLIVRSSGRATFATDEIVSKIITIFDAIRRSQPLHAGIIERAAALLFRLYRHSPSPASTGLIRTTFESMITDLFEAVRKPPIVPTADTIDALARQVTDTLLQDALTVHMALAPVLRRRNFTARVCEVDLLALHRVVCQTTLKGPPGSESFAINLLLFILKQSSKFFRTVTFGIALKKQIYPFFLSLLAKEHKVVLSPVFLITWERFAWLNKKLFYRFVVAGLVHSLKSTDPHRLRNALAVCLGISGIPQFFVDLYVNYDMSKSTPFSEVFEKLVNRVVATVNEEPSAIEIISRMLQGLWCYYNESRRPEMESRGLTLFQDSGQDGIRWFISQGVVDDTPDSIAHFLFTNNKLDVCQVGNVAGDSDAVCRSFFAHFDFRGASFHTSLRRMLSRVRVPADSARMDRFLREFARKFCADNPGDFRSSEAVYLLAFWSLLLNSDQHYQNTSPRITLSAFRSHIEALDLPRGFVDDLFRRISRKALFTTSASVVIGSPFLQYAQKANIYRKTCREKVQQIGARRKTQFVRFILPELVGPMFERVWGGIFGLLSKELQRPERWAMCVEGLSLCLRLAARCYVKNAFETVLHSLAGSTGLGKGQLPSDERQIACFKVILTVASEDFAFFKLGWVVVLRLLSGVDRLGGIPDGAALFTQSGTFDRESLVDFTSAACEVAKEELAEAPPRLFMVEQLSLIAFANVGRPHFIWISVWQLLGEFLHGVIASDNYDVACVGVNVLRSLAARFLPDRALSDFHFQACFMRTFLDGFLSQSSILIKEYLLDSLNQIVSSNGCDLRDGWPAAIQIVESSVPIASIQRSAFDVLRTIILSNIDHVRAHMTRIAEIATAFESQAQLTEPGFALKICRHLEGEYDWLRLIGSCRKVSEFADVIIAFASKPDRLDDVKAALESDLPKFYPEMTGEFFIELFSQLFSLLSKRSDILVHVVCDAVRSAQAEISTAAITQIEKFDSALTANVFEAVVPDIIALSGENVALLLETIDALSDRLDDKGVSLIDAAARLGAGGDSANKQIVLATVRLILHRRGCDGIGEMLRETLQLFADSGLVGDASLAGRTWADAVGQILRDVNRLDDEKFSDCFGRVKDLLMQLIVGASKEVRVEIGAALQRQL